MTDKRFIKGPWGPGAQVLCMRPSCGIVFPWPKNIPPHKTLPRYHSSQCQKNDYPRRVAERIVAGKLAFPLGHLPNKKLQRKIAVELKKLGAG